MKTFIDYSKYYDSIYRGKDYKSECDFVLKNVVKHSAKPPKKILSLGCGTCTYELLMAKKGIQITGIDLSSEMLEIASQKIKQAHLESKIKIFQSNVQKFSFKEKFDSALAMFNIAGYQVENGNFEAMLNNVNNSLTPGGVFAFDCWYMPAVLNDKPTDRVKEIKLENSRIIRITKSKLDINRNIIEITFKVLEMKGRRLISETEETHFMRYWSLPELYCFLEKAEFELVKVYNFMDDKSEISENNWDIFVVARKKR